MKAKNKFIRYLMLLAGVIMLLSVVVPHHHHNDGMPCYEFFSSGSEEEHEGTSSHDCGCNGHNQALFTSLLTQATDGDISHLLFPLQVLFDYINPPVTVDFVCSYDRDRTFYIESLHDTWVVSFGGLRAPPVL